MQDIEKEYTAIQITKANAKRLKDMGRKGETYDDIIKLLLDHKPKRLRPLKWVDK